MKKYEALVKTIVEKVGGKENIISVAHCATRLRFKLNDEGKADTAALKEVDGVITIIQSASQYQVVIGNHVSDVYKELCELIGFVDNQKEEKKKDMSFGAKAFDYFTGLIMPSVSVLCAGGIMKGINALLTAFGVLAATDGLYLLFAAAADAMFYFLPVLIGYNAFKKLGASPFVGLVLGAALVYPNIQSANLSVFGFTVNASYTSTLFPIAVLSLIAAPMEKYLNKVVPTVIRSFVVPTVVLMVCLPLGYCIIGPVANMLGGLLNVALNSVYAFNPLLGGVILAGTYQILVMMGMHVLIVLPIMMSIIQGNPSPLSAAMGIQCFVVAGATFAIWLKTKDAKLKEVALPAWISAVFGITEPALYGVTLPNGKQFLYTCFAAGIGGGLSILLNNCVYGLAGMGIFSIPGCIDPANPVGSMVARIVVVVASAVLGFLFAFVTFKDKELAK